MGCGSWYFHFEGMSAGRRVQYKRGGYATRRDAEAALAGVVDNNRRGVRPTPARLTVADYLTAWLTQKQVVGCLLGAPLSAPNVVLGHRSAVALGERGARARDQLISFVQLPSENVVVGGVGDEHRAGQAG